MKVLFLAYYFPPDSSSGSFRPFFFANHLSNLGVSVHVLTAKVEDFLPEQPLDSTLSGKLHHGVKVTRCSVSRPREALISLRNTFTGKVGSELKGTTSISSPEAAPVSYWQTFKDILTDLLATPDPHVGWVWDCVRRGKAVVAENRPDVIYATGSPWSGLLAGMLLKKATGIPLILDFRDPWTSNPSFDRRSSFIRSIDVFLEKMVVQAADGVIANTPTLRDDFLTKYPKLTDRRVISITNGFEEYVTIPGRRPEQPLTITHTGELYMSRNPTPLLEAVKRLIDQGQISMAEIRLQFVGGIKTLNSRVVELLADETLREVVTIVPRVSYEEAQRFASEADVLLLVQPDFPLQIPRKVFEYMAVRKPMLCIAESTSATGILVCDNRLGKVCNNTVQEIESVLKDLITAWKTNGLQSFSDDRCDAFRNSYLTQRFQGFIAEIVSHEPAVRS